MFVNSFDTLESAQEYVRLLASQVEAERASIEQDVAEAIQFQASRSATALHIVDYKLTQLSGHLTEASRIMNDLRMLRRLLLAEPQVTTTAIGHVTRTVPV